MSNFTMSLLISLLVILFQRTFLIKSFNLELLGLYANDFYGIVYQTEE